MSECFARRLALACVPLLALTFSLAADSRPESWQQVARFGGAPVRGAQIFAIGTSAYVVSGVIDGGTTTRQAWTYDAEMDTWDRLNDFPGTPASEGIGFSIDGAGYVCLGSTDTGTTADVREVWQYDPARDTWTRKADFPGTCRTGMAAVAIGRNAYVFGGGTGLSPLSELWEYRTDDDSWAFKASCPDGGHFTPAAFVIDDRAYFGLGASAGNPDDVTHNFWQYDPRLDVWTQKANFPGKSRISTASLTLGGRGYVVFGFPYPSPHPTPVRDVWEYNPSDDIWTRLDLFEGGARLMPAGFAMGDAIYCGLGTDDSLRNLGDIWRMRPAAQSP